MAGNKVDAIFASEAIAQIIKVKQELALIDDELIKMSQDASKVSVSFRNISSPSGLEKMISDSSQINAELERQNKIIQGLETQIKRLSQVRATNNKMSAEEAVNQRILNKNALDQAKAVSSLVGAYDKLSLAHQKAFKNAQNIGAQYGVTSDKFLKASEKANKLDAELKTLDATLGKHNRNVGNYASGYNALGNSINQLTREAPAFANSINTGFMALSNNFPALFDAINGIREQNKALAAEGKPTVSVLKSLALSFFGWQTLLSAGVTLLTLYGGKIFESITGSGKRKEALEKEKKALEEKTKAEQDARDSIASEQATEISKSKILLETAKNISLSYKQRSSAVKELQERYPDYLGHLSKEQILAGETAKAEEDLNNALINRGKALAAQKFLQTNLEKQLSLEIEIDKLSQKELKYNLEAAKNGNKIIVYTDAQKQIQQQKADLERQSNKENLFSLRERLSGLKNEQSAFLDIYNANAKYLGVVKETNKEVAKPKNAERAKKEAIELKSVADTISQINQQLDQLRVTVITGSESERAEASKAIEDLIELKKQLNALPTASTTILQPVKKEDVDNLKAMSEEMKAYMANFTSDFINQSGFTNTFKILNDEIDGFGENASVTFNAIAESAQEMFNFISNASQANFDAEYSRLESQKDISLKFAGDSATSKKKIEEDYEKKKKEIANRENKAKQKQAIFNIAIDTAQAIVASFIRDPTGITAAIIGALGAAQIAVVAAQKIPQYFDGGVHGGGLAMINDAGGSNYVETVVTPDGKVQQFKGRDVVTDLPKGTEIFTPEQWQQKELEYMLNSRGIMLNNQVNKGMTAEQMDMIMAKHFSKIQTNTTVFDKKGIMQWTESRNSKTIRNANRATGRGFNV